MEKVKKPKVYKAPRRRPAPMPQERYPHSHYEEKIDYEWVYRQIGILKSWEQTLTHLMLKLAEIENADITKIVDELQKLFDTLHEWIDTLEAYLAELTKAESRFTDANTKNADLLYNLVEYLAGFIADMTPAFEALFNCIEDTLKRHDQYINELKIEVDKLDERLTVVEEQITDIYKKIEDINNQIEQILSYIEDIYNILEDITSQDYNTKTLTQGTDYNTYFYNNFFMDTENGRYDFPLVQASDTVLNTPNKKFHSVEIYIETGTTHWLSNSVEVTEDSNNCPQFKHGNDVMDVPRSWIFAIEFTDADKYKNLVSTDTSTSLVWNMRPTSRRASWNVRCGMNQCNIVSGQPVLSSSGNALLICMNQIGDGFNSQYDSGYYDYPMTFQLLNSNLWAFYTYTE